MNNKNILISGAGIAGVALAYWLKKFGFRPTIVEVSPTLREGGYAIDFMGAGYDVAEKMGVIPALERADIGISKLVFVDSDDRATGSMNYEATKRAMNGRALTLLRSDLARVIYECLDKDIEILYGDTITELKEEGEQVHVRFRSGASRQYDLVIGADGLHSVVRGLIFGKEEQFEKYCGYYTSSYTLGKFDYSGNAFSMYNVPGKQVAVYTYGDDRKAAFFIFASAEKISYDHHDVAKQKELLRTAFENSGWRCPDLLGKMETAPDFYFDSVSQIQIEQWHRGRVALVGDACFCPSLLSGKGSTLAMVGAYMLARELKLSGGDYKVAFRNYQELLKPFMEEKQKSARSFAKSFVPKSRFGIGLRNVVFKLMSFPFVSRLYLGQFKDKSLHLKDY